jgi:hypothetical protein
MKRWLVVGSLVLGGGLAWAAPTGSKASLELPSGSKLVGSVQAGELRAFPEMNKDKGMQTQDIVSMGALDRVYETKRSYKDAVGYFDSMVKDGSATELSRTVTRTTTGWQLQLPDGNAQNIVVRNTQPTTIETVQAVGALERDTFKSSGAAADKKSNAKTSTDTKATDTTPPNLKDLKTQDHDNQ